MDAKNIRVLPIRALRLPDVMLKTGLSRTHTYRLIKWGEFPPPHKLSERVSAWNEADIDAWLAEKFSGGAA
jgi:prophage regulatory protein